MDDDFFKTRNSDQVVSKQYQRMETRSHEDVPIIMVPQLWMWKMGNLLLVACSTAVPGPSFGALPRESDVSTSREDGRSSAIYWAFDGELSINLQIGLRIACPIDKFGLEGAKFRSPLHLFEMAVFSALSDVQRYLNDAPEYQTIKEQKKSEQEFIHAILDIHSELDMIQHVLEQQGKVLDALLKDTEEERKQACVMEWRMVERARVQLDVYAKRILKIHRDADRVEKVIESYLTLKRTYATIEDTRNSLMMGFAASAFAFVTVIFTPLNFMTSLFALPVDRFVRQQGNDTTTSTSVYRSSYIGGYTALTGIVTWLLTAGMLYCLYRQYVGKYKPPHVGLAPGDKFVQFAKNVDLKGRMTHVKDSCTLALSRSKHDSVETSNADADEKDKHTKTSTLGSIFRGLKHRSTGTDKIDPKSKGKQNARSPRALSTGHEQKISDSAV